MQLPPKHMPIVLFNSLDSIFAQEIAFSLISSSVTIATTHPLPYSSSLQLTQSVWQIPHSHLSHIQDHTIYSCILDPYFFSMKPDISTDHFPLLSSQIQMSKKSIFLTPERIIIDHEESNQRVNDSDQLIHKLQNVIQNHEEFRANICFTRDQFDSDLNPLLSPVNFLFTKISSHQLHFPFTGQEVLYPSPTSDIAKLIPKILFGHTSPKKSILIHANQSLISINLLFTIQKSYQQVYQHPLDVVYQSTQAIISRISPEQAELITYDNHSLASSINNTLLAKKQTTSETQPNSLEINSSSKIISSRKGKVIKKILIFGGVLASSIFMIATISIVLLKIFNSNLTTSVNNEKLMQNASPLNAASVSITKHITLPLLSMGQQLPPLQYLYQSTTALLLENQIFQTEVDLNQKLIQLYYQTVDTDIQNDPNLITKIESLARNQHIQMSQYKQFQSPQLSPEFQIGEGGAQLLLATKAIKSILYQHNQANILVVFYDENQVDSSRGTIINLSLLEFQHGKLMHVTTQDPEFIDQMVGGQASAPEEFTKVTDQTSWSIKDANWNPDFYRSAQDISWLYQKATQAKVDAVVVMPISQLQILIADQLFQSDQFGDITAQNLSQKIDQIKKDPALNLTDLTTQLFSAIHSNASNLSSTEIIHLYQQLYQQLNASNIVIASSDATAQAYIQELGWGGEITHLACQSIKPELCFSETFHLHQTTLSNILSDQKIESHQFHSINFTDDNIKHTHTISITNNPNSNLHSATTYQSYLRAIIPYKASLESIAINSEKVDVTDIIQTQLNQLTSYGTKVIVPVGESVDVSYSYNTPIPKETKPLHEYQLNLIKQPGVSSGTWQIELSSDTTHQMTTVLWGSVQQNFNNFKVVFDSNSLLKVAFLP